MILLFTAIFLFLVLLLSGVVLIRREREAGRALSRRLRETNTRFKALSSELGEEKARLETTFSGMSEGAILTDQRGDILLVNPAFREMFGLKGQVENRSALEILASVACDDAIREVIREKKPVEQEIKFEKPKPRVFQVHFSPMTRDGKLFGVVSIFHDLTEIRRLEEVRRDFIANLSHELKTPLTAIRGYSETLLEESSRFPEASRKHLEIILRHAVDLEHLTENLLNLSRIESGKEEVLLQAIQLKDFVARLLERFASQAKVRQIELCNEVTEASPPLVADPSKLNQILSNLVDNAIKYTQEGGRVIVRGGECEIEVEDNGPGIPAGERERIFERFYRLDKARSRDSGGTGLGLAIVKHLVELHGGQIEIVSSPNRGAKFKITLPRTGSPARDQQKPHP